MNKYLIKVNSFLIKKFKPFLKKAQIAEDNFYKEIDRIEKEIEKATGIDAELFRCDGEIVGIGNYKRTMRLIHREELE